ncbi:MAG: pilus assembly protein PilM [Planctomycetes bacterium]|nr:pilus assembly protein PilM [Planctomycetota bacterium]
MAEAFALDLGAREVKFVRVGGSAKSPKLLAYERIPLPAPGAALDPSIVQQLVADLAVRHKLAKKRLIISLPPERCAVREISYPITDEAQIEKTIAFQAEQYLFSLNLEDVQLAWFKMREVDQKARLFLAAANKEYMRAVVAACAAAGIEKVVFDTALTALFNAARGLGHFAEKSSYLLLDLGAAWSKLLAVANGQPLVMRSFRLSLCPREGAEPAAASAGESTPPPPPAPTGAASEPTPTGGETAAGASAAGEATAAEGAPPAQAAPVDTPVARLQRELTRALSSLGGRFWPERVYITGGGTLAPGAAEFLSQLFGVETVWVDPSKGMRLAVDPAYHQDFQAFGLQAAGLALKGLGGDAAKLNFIRGEFARAQGFSEIQRPLAVCVTLLVLLLGGLTAVFFQMWREARRFNQSTLISGVMAVYDRIPDPDLKPPTESDLGIEDYQKHIEEWDRTRYEENLIPYLPVPSALRIWRDVFAAIDAAKPSDAFSLTNITITETEVQLRGTTFDPRFEEGRIQTEFGKIRNFVDDPLFVPDSLKLGPTITAVKGENTFSVKYPFTEPDYAKWGRIASRPTTVTPVRAAAAPQPAPAAAAATTGASPAAAASPAIPAPAPVQPAAAAPPTIAPPAPTAVVPPTPPAPAPAAGTMSPPVAGAPPK